MKLITKKEEKLFEKYPLYSQEGKGMDSKVVVKFFNPVGSGTWLITEGEQQGDDFIMYGYCHICDWEWGYVSLNELKGLRLPLGLSIEREMYDSGGKYTVGQLVR